MGAGTAASDSLTTLLENLRIDVYPDHMETEPFEMLSHEQYEKRVGRAHYLLETEESYRFR